MLITIIFVSQFIYSKYQADCYSNEIQIIRQIYEMLYYNNAKSALAWGPWLIFTNPYNVLWHNVTYCDMFSWINTNHYVT